MQELKLGLVVQAGLDSLGARELRSAIAARVSVPLPASITFDYPTPEALANFIYAKQLAAVTLHSPPDLQPAVSSSKLPQARLLPAVHGGIAIVGLACTFPGAEQQGGSLLTQQPYKSIVTNSLAQT